MEPLPPQDVLRKIFAAFTDAALPGKCLAPHIPDSPRGKTIVVGAGKASAAMARVVEQILPSPLSGLVVTRYGHEVPCKKIEIIEASHPVPDAAGRDAAERILETVGGLSADDLVLCLISGGGSALLSLPAPGVPLEDKRAVTDELLFSGATIREFNCVRKHLSAIKGGRLAAACHPARVLSLVISDVPGDDLSAIASGPTVPDPSTSADALAVLAKYAVKTPASVIEHLHSRRSETPKPGDPCFEFCEAILIATPSMALDAAAKEAKNLGYDTLVLGDAIEGESREVAREQAVLALEKAARGKPLVILSGGETTVTVKGKGRGGPNSEFLLSLAVALDGFPGVHAIACDSDGIDGSEDNAGASINPTTLARAADNGLDAEARLADNDAYGFFAPLGDLIVTGPTLTNVNDFRAILIEGK